MTRLYAIGLTLLCLMLFACGGKAPVVITETKTARLVPPAVLLEPTPEPDCLPYETNGDLKQCSDDRLEALRKSNRDKAAIKVYLEREQ